MTNRNGNADSIEENSTSINSSANKSKILRRYFVDHGKYISFPNSVAYSHYPAGIFYPETEERTGDFVLKRIDPMNKRAAEDLVKEHFDDELSSCIADIFEEDTGNFKRRDINRLLKRIEDSTFLNEGYFPMEKWNEGIQRVDTSIRNFLNNRELYEKKKLDYRRSFLIYGEHGSGKSRYIDHICKVLIEQHDSIIIRLDSMREVNLTIERGLIPLEANLGDRLKVFVIEEFAQISGRSSNYADLLNFMDNAIMRHNLIFILSSNSPQKIPKPFVDRPGRIDVLEKVGTNYRAGFPEAFYEFITGQKLPERSQNESWYSAKLPASYLKELFLVSMLNNESPEITWKEIERRKNLISSEFDERDRLDMIM